MARNDFDAVEFVDLNFWSRRDIATAWCEQSWRKLGRPYRRSIDASAQTVRFEFNSAVAAMAFRLAMANAFRPPYAPAEQ